VAQVLFSDPAYFRDPWLGSDGDRRRKLEASAGPVNPDDLIVRLDDIREPQPHTTSVQQGTLSLTGVLRLLFEGEAKEEEESIVAGIEVIDDGAAPDAAPPPKPIDKMSDDLRIEARFRERLATQIATFLDEMSMEAFARRCTATQMVQAVAFPLAVALRGRSRGWVRPELAEAWALRVFAILFRGGGSPAKGLLRAVESRYVAEGKGEAFDNVVGDGTLWLVLVATLGGARWDGVGASIDKAIALREVYSAPQLTVAATSDRIAGLLGTIRIEDAQTCVRDIAPRVSRLLGEIERKLRQVWRVEMRDQRERAIVHGIGDLFWREGAGWAICLERMQERADQPVRVRFQGAQMAVMSGFYVNVTDVCARDSNLRSLVADLQACFATTGPRASDSSNMPSSVSGLVWQLDRQLG